MDKGIISVRSHHPRDGRRKQWISFRRFPKRMLVCGLTLACLVGLGSASAAAAAPLRHPNKTANPKMGLPPSKSALSHARLRMSTYTTHGIHAPKGDLLANRNLRPPANRRPPAVNSRSAPAASSPQFQYQWAVHRGVGQSDGATDTMDIAEPLLDAPTDYHTLGELMVLSADGMQRVEVGWTVDYNVNGDLLPHLFVYHWVDGAQTCYNGCGFVRYSGSAFPGEILPVGARKAFSIMHYQGNWWIAYDGAWFGYYPDLLWGNRYTSSGEIDSYGEVSTSVPDYLSCTEMGNGRYSEDPSSAAMQVTVINRAQDFTWLTPYATDPAYYSVTSTGSNSIRYGGPAPIGGYCYEKPRIVPNVIGDYTTTAGQKLQASGLVIRNIFYQSDGLPFGTVDNQYPAAGSQLTPGSAVDLLESNGQS